MDNLFHNILSIGLKEIFIFALSPLIIAIYQILKNQKLKNEILLELKNSEKIRNLLISLSMRLHFLDSTVAIVLRRHNGAKWSNGQSMQKLSIYEYLSINHNHTELSNYLESVNISKFKNLLNHNVTIDLISICDLKNFYLYDILLKENIKYLIVSKIESGKKLNGLLIILSTDIPNYSKPEFRKIKLISNEIGKFFD